MNWILLLLLFSSFNQNQDAKSNCSRKPVTYLKDGMNRSKMNECSCKENQMSNQSECMKPNDFNDLIPPGWREYNSENRFMQPE